MADRPIPFSAPMVRALLDERKTQTRRYLTPWTEEPPAFVERGVIMALDERDRPYRWPRTYAVCDRLYVREHWRTSQSLDAIAPRDMVPPVSLFYEADNSALAFSCGRFRQWMHMPRWASRITLLVTEVRVERLQDCSEADAVAEGCEAEEFICCNSRKQARQSARSAFRFIWEGLHGPGAWATNPWVAAYTFTVERGNIGQIGEAR